MQELKEKIKHYLSLIDQDPMLTEICLAIQRGLTRNENGKWEFISTENSSQKILRGIWLHIEDYPGRNRGRQMFLYFQYPHFLTVTSTDYVEQLLPDRLRLRGKYLHYILEPDDIDQIEDHIARFEKVILASLYLYTKEKEEQGV